MYKYKTVRCQDFTAVFLSTTFFSLLNISTSKDRNVEFLSTFQFQQVSRLQCCSFIWFLTIRLVWTSTDKCQECTAVLFYTFLQAFNFIFNFLALWCCPWGPGLQLVLLWGLGVPRTWCSVSAVANVFLVTFVNQAWPIHPWAAIQPVPWH